MSTEFRVRNNIGYPSVVQEAKKLGQELRVQVIEALSDASAEYGNDEHRYVVSKIDKKLSYTDASSTAWIKELSMGFRQLYNYYQAISVSESRGSNQFWPRIGATLFYFINPFDIIPDHTPSTGYLDDAFAFYYCVRQLPEDWDSQFELG